MTKFQPIEAVHRLEAKGFRRTQAEALAQELQNANDALVTKEELDAALAKQAMRICAVLGAGMALGFTALGVLISIALR